MNEPARKSSPRFVIRTMTVGDHARVHALWRETEGMGLHRDSDARAPVGRYLRRNPGMSFVALSGGRIVGAVLCGHDGRRGYLHHLAVDKRYRGHGIAAALVGRCLAALRRSRVPRCNILVFDDNVGGQEFWRHNGWKLHRNLVFGQARTGRMR